MDSGEPLRNPAWTRLLLATMDLEFLATGISLCLITKTGRCFFQLQLEYRKRNLYLLSLSLLLSAAYLCMTVLDTRDTDGTLFGGANLDTGNNFTVTAKKVQKAYMSLQIGISALSNFMLIYRCLLLYSNRIWVLIIPAVMELAALGLGILQVSGLDALDIARTSRDLTIADTWMRLSIFVNITVTALIFLKILASTDRIANLMALSVESNLPAAAAGVATVIALSTYDSDMLFFIASRARYALSAICSQLVILRIMKGQAWEVNRKGYASGTWQMSLDP
ncbi:hypothetical protein D9611_012930 [Ephemerocybe angulata]|uniref:Uncharacterized protein n=1 Tax=Ephemerocybe angulata TaxID=980116 RepID=A0A8H5C3Y0_9AGAR|nr:hypothetical protein D9611_012930 [Tulosesus angulatus]